MPDGPSRIMNGLGFIAGLAGAMMGLLEEGKAAFYTEAGVALVCIITEAFICAGFLDSIGRDT